MDSFINLADEDFKDFIISQMSIGQIDFWWQAYTLLNVKPIKVTKTKSMTPEAIKKRVQQWPQEN